MKFMLAMLVLVLVTCQGIFAVVDGAKKPLCKDVPVEYVEELGMQARCE